MKLSDFIFRFPTCGITKSDALCRVRLFVSSDRAVYAVLTDLGVNSHSPIVETSPFEPTYHRKTGNKTRW